MGAHVVILPTLPGHEVNHRSLAHGLGAIEVPGPGVVHADLAGGWADIAAPEAVVNHMFPPGLTTTSVAWAGMVYMVTDPEGVIRASSEHLLACPWTPTGR